MNKKIFCASLLIGIILFAAGRFSAQALFGQSLLNGRWDVSFDTEKGEWFSEPIGIEISEDKKTTVTMLGPSAIKFSEGRIEGNKLLVEGSSRWIGAIKLSAAVSGEVLEGRWNIDSSSGRIRGTRHKSNDSPSSFAATFDTVWGTINKLFYDPKFNGADWKSALARYRPLAEAARSEGEFVRIMREMLAELRSSHVEFYLEPQKPASVASTQTAAVSAPVLWRKLTPEIGYIQIKRFSTNPEHLKLVDGAFAELGGLKSIVIDLRDNPGGSLGIAMRLGDYLWKSSQPIGFLTMRGGLSRFKVDTMDELNPTELQTFTGYEADDFSRELTKSGALMLVTGGRAARTYDGRIAILINNRSGSASEAVAGVFKETKRATLIGQRTAGAMLNGTEIPVAGGWTLVVPVADFRTPGGVRIEEKGVEPNIPVEPDVSPNAVLELAVKHLGGGTNAPSQNEKSLSQPDEKWKIWQSALGFDVRALLTESEAHSAAMQGMMVRDYSFVQKETYRMTDKNGQIKKEKSKAYEAYPVPGQISVVVQIGENGVPLSPEKISKEREKAVKNLEKASRKGNYGAEVQAADKPKEKKQWYSWRIRSKKLYGGTTFWINPHYFLRAGAIYAARRESIDGRETLVVEFRPKSNFTPAEKSEEVAAKLAGKIWIDISEKVIVRVEAYPADEVFNENRTNANTISSGDANAPVIIYEQMRLPEGLWVPKMWLFDSSRRKELFDGINMNNVMEFSDYKRYNVEVREKADE